MKNSYKDEDYLVYSITRLINDYVNDRDNYDTDSESFGKTEWWLTPQEAFDYYIDNEGDCDDKRALLWGAIISALKFFGYETETWRLMCVDIIEPVGHALLVWLKKNGVWTRIETTYYPNSIVRTFYDDSTSFFKGELIRVWHLFNEKTEYELKN
jgi:hypothetical protein